MVKSLEFILLSKLQQSLYKWFFFCQILFNLARKLAVHHERSFVPAFLGVSIDHLFVDNLESGKRNPRLLLLFQKNVWTEKVMNFGSKNLYKPCSNTACRPKIQQSNIKVMKKGNDQQLEKILIAKQIFAFSTMGKVYDGSHDDVRVWRVNPWYLSFYMLTTSASKVEVLISQVPAGHSPSLLTSKFKRLGWVLARC